MWHPKKNLDPFLHVFSHFFMSYFDILGSIFEKWPMTDLLNVIVSMCLVSYNFCMIPHVWARTFGLNLSGAWGVLLVEGTEGFLSYFSRQLDLVSAAGDGEDAGPAPVRPDTVPVTHHLQYSTVQYNTVQYSTRHHLLPDRAHVCATLGAGGSRVTTTAHPGVWNIHKYKWSKLNLYYISTKT